jgi:hypothetical protein
MPPTRSIMSRTDLTCYVRMLATHTVLSWCEYRVHMVCTRSENCPCTRSAGIRDSSLTDYSFQRPILFRLGQVTDQVVLHLCLQRSRRTHAACRTAGRALLMRARGIAMRRGPGGSFAANMGCPGCRGVVISGQFIKNLLHNHFIIKNFNDDPSFIVLTETKFSFRCIPVWDPYSPHRTRVEKKSTCDNALTMTSPVHW